MTLLTVSCDLFFPKHRLFVSIMARRPRDVAMEPSPISLSHRILDVQPEWSRCNSFSSNSNDSAVFSNNSSFSLEKRTDSNRPAIKRNRNSSGSSASSSLSYFSDKGNKSAIISNSNNADDMTRTEIGTSTFELQHKTLVNNHISADSMSPFRHNLRRNIRKKTCSCDCTATCTTLVVRRYKEIGQKTVQEETVISSTKVLQTCVNNATQELHKVTYEKSYSPTKSDGNRKRRSEVEKLYDSLHEIEWAKNFSPDNILRQIHVRQAASCSMFGRSTTKPTENQPNLAKRHKGEQNTKKDSPEGLSETETSKETPRSTRSFTLRNLSGQSSNHDSLRETVKNCKRNLRKHESMKSNTTKEQNKNSSESKLKESSIDHFEPSENSGKSNVRKTINIPNSLIDCKLISAESIDNKSLQIKNHFDFPHPISTLIPKNYNSGPDVDNLELTSEHSLTPTFFNIAEEGIRTIDACFREVGAEVVISTCYEADSDLPLLTPVKDSSVSDKVVATNEYPPVLEPCMSYSVQKDDSDSLRGCQAKSCIIKPGEGLFAKAFGNADFENSDLGLEYDYADVSETCEPRETPDLDTYKPIESSNLELSKTREFSDLKMPKSRESSDMETCETKGRSDLETCETGESSNWQSCKPRESFDLEICETGESSDLQTCETGESSNLQTCETGESSDLQTRDHREIADLQTCDHRESSDLQICDLDKSFDLETCETGASSDLQTCKLRKSFVLETCETEESSYFQTCDPRESSDLQICDLKESFDLETCKSEESSNLQTCKPRESFDLKNCETRESSVLQTCKPIESSDLEICESGESSDLQTCNQRESSDFETWETNESSDLQTCNPTESSILETCETRESSDLQTCVLEESSDLQTCELGESSDLKECEPREISDLKTCEPIVSSYLETCEMEESKVCDPKKSSDLEMCKSGESSDFETTEPRESGNFNTCESKKSSDLETCEMDEFKMCEPKLSSDFETCEMNESKICDSRESSNFEMCEIDETKTCEPRTSSDLQTCKPIGPSEFEINEPRDSSDFEIKEPKESSDFETCEMNESKICDSRESSNFEMCEIDETKTCEPKTSSDLQTCKPIGPSEFEINEPRDSSDFEINEPKESSDFETCEPNEGSDFEAYEMDESETCEPSKSSGFKMSEMDESEINQPNESFDSETESLLADLNSESAIEKGTSKENFSEIVNRTIGSCCTNNSLIKNIAKRILNKYLRLLRTKYSDKVVSKIFYLSQMDFVSPKKKGSSSFERSTSDKEKPSTSANSVFQVHRKLCLSKSPKKATFNLGQSYTYDSSDGELISEVTNSSIKRERKCNLSSFDHTYDAKPQLPPKTGYDVPDGSSTISKPRRKAFSGDYRTLIINRFSGYYHVVLKPTHGCLSFFTVESLGELKEVIRRTDLDPTCHALILNGKGTSFSMGLDLRPLLEAEDRQKTSINMAVAVKEFVEALSSFRKPLVAVVNGAAYGLGLTVLNHADSVIASEKATFRMPQTTLGYFPEGGATFTLPRAVGSTVAMDLIVRGRVITAHEAQSIGLITEVYVEKNIPIDVIAQVQELTKNTLSSMETTKAMLKMHLHPQLVTVLENEVKLLPQIWQSDSCQSMLEREFTVT